MIEQPMNRLSMRMPSYANCHLLRTGWPEIVHEWVLDACFIMLQEETMYQRVVRPC